MSAGAFWPAFSRERRYYWGATTQTVELLACTRISCSWRRWRSGSNGKGSNRIVRLPFSVEVVEPTGSETQVQGKLGRQPFTGVFRERINTRPGETIRVAPQADAIHLFDARSSQRLN